MGISLVPRLRGRPGDEAKWACHVKSIYFSQDREAVLTHFHALKQEMNTCREHERNCLTKLTLQSDAAIKLLEKKREKVSKKSNYAPQIIKVPPSTSTRVTGS